MTQVKIFYKVLHVRGHSIEGACSESEINKFLTENNIVNASIVQHTVVLKKQECILSTTVITYEVDK